MAYTLKNKRWLEMLSYSYPEIAQLIADGEIDRHGMMKVDLPNGDVMVFKSDELEYVKSDKADKADKTETSVKPCSIKPIKSAQMREAVFNRWAGIKSSYKAVKAMKNAGDKNFLFAVNFLAEECQAFAEFVHDLNKKVRHV